MQVIFQGVRTEFNYETNFTDMNQRLFILITYNSEFIIINDLKKSALYLVLLRMRIFVIL
ncbi:hypothetical protein CDQ85_18605 [Clostridium thermosuccinogenes]|nr:hypothetical protein CDO33_06385 [Pseudoclostridium thermosuccinogenes]PNT91844.1 hypothetical protein CDQ85_18605 [Pseudoclostridium thermosuccinogenes]